MRPSRAHASSSIDRSIASRCLRSRRARRPLPSSLERDNHITSHQMMHRASGRAEARLSPSPRHSIPHTQTPNRPSNKTITTHAKIQTPQEPDRWHLARLARPRARAASRRRSIARESFSRARETSARPRDSTRVSSVTRSVGRSSRSSRSMDEGDGERARTHRARMGRRARTARAMRTRARRKSRCERIEARERDEERDRGARARRVRRSFGDDSRGGRRLDRMKSKSLVRSNGLSSRGTDERGKRDGCERW